MDASASTLDQSSSSLSGFSYLYTKPSCKACEKARELLGRKKIPYFEVVIDNPLLELGIQTLFNQNLILAPIIVIPDKGIYLIDSEGLNLLKIVSLDKKEVPESVH